MMDVLAWLKKQLTLLNALTFVLAIATALYTRQTYRILHAPYRSFLVPTKYEMVNGSYVFTIRNCGPGIATKIVLSGIAYTDIEFQNLEKPDKVWANVSRTPADGPHYLMANVDGEYVFRVDGFLQFEQPFIIKWITITNKVQKSYWRTIPYGQDGRMIQLDKFLPLTITERYKFMARRFKIWLFSPYHRIHRRVCLWERRNKKGG